MAASVTSRWRNFLVLVAVIAALLLPRWLAVSQSATIDESKWVARAANFSYALSHSQLADTYQSEHPGVTVMWAGTLALKVLFPKYSSLAPGLLAPHELDQFLKQQGYTPLQALVAGRQVMLLFNVLALVLIFLYARRLLGLPTALLSAVFSAFSPFFAAHTHLMHLDGLAGSWMVLSLLAFLSYDAGHNKRDLLLSGSAAGLAWLTKTPAFVLGPTIVIIAGLLYWANRQKKQATAVRDLLSSLLIWTLSGLITFVLLWPAMWVEPVHTFQRIIQETLSYAGGGHGEPVFFNGAIYSDGRIPARVFYFYPLTYLWRSTPVVLSGLPLVLLALWQRWSPLDGRRARNTILSLLAYAFFFMLFMTLGDKKFDRYLIPVYPALHLASAAGWISLSGWLKRRWAAERNNKRLYSALLIGILAAWQLWALSRAYPYYLSYYNPLLGGNRRAPQVMQIGWGEGLDAAGRYLNAKAERNDLVVASWYRSALAYYFDGETISINAELSPEAEAAIQSADYAVIYIHQWQRDVPATLLDQVESLTPEQIITINGLEYARVYDLQP